MYFVCSFSLLAQRKRTSSEAAKERAAVHLVRFQRTILHVFKKDGRCETRFAQTVLALFPSFLKTLGCMKWHHKNI